jgi:hypothetical protein
MFIVGGTYVEIICFRSKTNDLLYVFLVDYFEST